MKHIFLRKSRRRTTSSPEQPVNTHPVAETPPDPTALFRQTRERAIGYGDELIHALSDHLRQGQRAELADLWELLPFYVDVVATADAATTLTAAPPTRPCEGLTPAIPGYIVSSLFLTKCYHYLMGDVRGFERLHLVTGIKLGETSYTLDHMEKVALSQQSPTRAVADQNAFNRALIELDSFGHYLHGLFHRHPGTGVGATRPSEIDVTTHKRHEDGGYPLIGAIFVEDGYVRFFTSNQPFTLTIYGKGIEPVSGESNVYQIHPTQTRCVSFETLASEG